MSEGCHIFLLAGESSGDRLGAALMRRLREESADTVRFSGVGGEAMIAEGLEPLFPMSDISVIGFLEVIPHIRRILRRMREASDAIESAPPDALVTIDAQVFSAMLAKRIARSLPSVALIHYVAPTVWAWKPWRAKKLAAYLDRAMALFPFEPPYFEREGLVCDFVGHPVVERAASIPDDAGQRLRERLGIAADAKVLLIAPGSRSSEIARLAGPFGDAAKQLASRFPDLEIVLPVAAPVADQVKQAAADWPAKTHILDPRGASFEDSEARKFSAFAAADVAIAASGTITLELAALRVPHIVGYRMPKLNEFIARRMMSVDTGTLVNIITGEKLIPEFWQDQCNGDALSQEATRLLTDADARHRQKAGFDRAFEALGEGDAPPSVRAARSVLAALSQKRQRFSTAT